MITSSFILGATWELEKTEVPGFKRIGERTEERSLCIPDA